MNPKKEILKERCADDFLKLFIKYTELLSPEEVLGIIECFKYVYMNKYVNISLQKLKEAREE